MPTPDTPDSLQGHLIVAAPKLRDPNFFKAVVLLVQHNEEGALGLILNRPLGATIEAAWEQVTDTPCLVSGVLHQGGPCEGPLMVVHTEPELSQIEVTTGVHFSTEKDAIEQLVARDDAGRTRMRFFVGYSGWGPGQLEAEIEHASWLSAPAAPDQVFGPTEDLWDAVMKLIARSAATPYMDPKIIPDDPSMN
jgi:putative transcriptional regulator